MKIKIFFVIIFLNIAILTSCNYKDLDKYYIALGMAIDKDAQLNNYKLTIEAYNFKTGEKGNIIQPLLIESTGKTITDAVANSVSISGKELTLVHIKVIIISQELAQEGIISSIDWIFRNNISPQTYLLISTDKTAKEIMQTSTEPAPLVSISLFNLISSNYAVSSFISQNVIELISSLQNKTASAVLPVVSSKKSDGKTIFTVNSSAVFKGDKVSNFLNDQESKIALLIRNDLKGGILSVDEKNNEDSVEKISLKILKSKTKINPINHNGKIVIEIKSAIDTNFVELKGSSDYISIDKRDILKRNMENMLANQIKTLVHKTQKNSSTDIFGFSSAIQRRMPQFFKEIEPNWDVFYKSIEIQPVVNINIEQSGYASKPLEIGD